MSRIGKNPVSIPKGVKAAVSGGALTVEGPLGKLEQRLHPSVTVEVDSAASAIKVTRDGDGRLDACEVAQGDFNLDGEIGAADLAELLSLWGSVNQPYGDLNDDGVIGAQDLAVLLDHWGPLY